MGGRGMKFCKECGTLLTEGVTFCKECGTPISSEFPRQIDEQKVPAPVNSQRTDPPKNMSKKTKYSLAASGIALVVLFGGYKTGEALTSKEHLIEKFEYALLENDAKTVAKLLSSNDKKVEFDEKTVKGFMDYFKENPEEMNVLIKSLKGQAKFEEQSEKLKGNEMAELAKEFLLDEGVVNLEKDGKVLFYDKYELNIDPIYVDLSTNYKDTVLTIDGEKVGTANQPNFKKTYGPFIPGIHKIKADLKTDFVELTKEEEVTLLNAGNKESVSISLDGQNVIVDLGVNGEDVGGVTGKLLINGKDVKVDPFTNPSFGPVLVDGSMKLSVEAELPWGKLKTEEVKINENRISINLANSESVEKATMEQVMKYMNEYYQAITSQDFEKFTTVQEHWKDRLKESFTSYHENGGRYIGTFNSMKFDLNSYRANYFNGMWTVFFDAQGELNESWYSDGNTPELQDVTTSYAFALIYDVNSKKWLIDSVESSFSFDEENIKEIKLEKPIKFTSAATSGTSAKTTSTAVTSTMETKKSSEIPEEIRTLMNGYEQGLIAAINNNVFSKVQAFLYPDSQLYNDQIKLVENLNKKGIKEELIAYEITDLFGEGGQISITTHEKIKISYSDGTSETKEYNWVYSAEEYNGSIRLKNIKAK
jgi:uncharacterized membrane protein YvbJ